MHGSHAAMHARGRMQIEHGVHPFARLLAWMLRLPRPSVACDTRLIVTALGDEERWERTFNDRRIQTRQYICDDTLAERFGVLEFRFRLEASDGSLVYVQRDAALLCLPVRVRIPMVWAPHIEAREDPAGPRRIQVGVRVALPGVGLLIAYSGLVEIEEPQP
jgi:uncharacterized protein DUF4166